MMLRVLQTSLVLALIIPFLFSIGCSSKTPPTSEEPLSEKKPESFPTVETEFGEQEFTNSIGMKMRLIPAGKFMMGSPEDEENRQDDESLHQVEITKPFYLGICEVTQGEWEAVMETTPWSGVTYAMDGANYPATYVNWEDVQEFCRRLSSRDGMSYRLPTEAEWEYACRAGSTTAFCFGDSYSSLGEYAWYDENAWDSGQRHPGEAGRKQANAWGLHDMHGNVWEWCQDWYDSDYDGAGTVDPRGPSTGEGRVDRGGCWFDLPWSCRSASRGKFTPGIRGYFLGFRLACSVE